MALTRGGPKPPSNEDLWTTTSKRTRVPIINAFFPFYPFQFLLTTPLSLPPSSLSSADMEPADDLQPNQLGRVDSDLTSNGSGLEESSSSSSFLYGTTSSGSFSAASGSSGEIPVSLVEDAGAPATRRRCVGGNAARWGSTSVIGRRKEMEDAIAVVPGFMSGTCDHVGGCTAAGSRTSREVSPVHFFGVYDGHGGFQVAKYCKERMHEFVAEEWDQGTVESDNEWQRRWKTALTNSFKRADNDVSTDAVSPEMVGSTSVVVVLSGCQIIASNCGDSRAVLCRRTQTIALTIDQKPDRQDELMRIEGTGGKVINWNGARVFGVLSMSRAIGDRYLRPWIIPVPEITFTTRTDEDECLILASDGLWDVMANEEVGEVARRLLRRWRRSIMPTDISPAQAIADNLTEMAYNRNSSDNISIIVVDLKSNRRRQAREEGMIATLVDPERPPTS